VAIIDPEGLFNGDRLRRCSNAAQLHWPRLFLAADGFARVELNYVRIIGRAYPTFHPVPSETELQALIEEYAHNHLLFVYEANGQLWAQWDTRTESLPRYKTARDRRSPSPPEPAFTQWKQAYRTENKAFPKSFRNLSETFQYGVGVGVGVGKNICASTDDDPVTKPPLRTKEPNEQAQWFATWWDEYWLRKAKKAAHVAFLKKVKTEERFERVMCATRAQKSEMLSREPGKRPHGATWLNGERWEDEPATGPQLASGADDYPELAR